MSAKIPKDAEPTQSEIKAWAIAELLAAVLPRFDEAINRLGERHRTKKAAARIRRIRQDVARLPMHRDGGVTRRPRPSSLANLRPRQAK